MQISSDTIIRQGLAEISVLSLKACPLSVRLMLLEIWLNTNPFVEYASRIENSIMVKFIDGSYTVLLDPFPVKTTPFIDSSMNINYEPVKSLSGSSAVLLNPDEYVYGHRQCQQIITTLLRHDYSIHYLANDAVTLSYLRENLSADIVYMNTHAGFFDTDGDHQADAVVIATGEPWTNDTEHTYNFEYEHHMIVKGMIGDTSIIAFTPAFIEYYYPPGTLPNSLVYMATCFATYDSSMAQAFLDAGASTYVGWSANTWFWINSRTSVQAFHLFASGFTVHQVCSLIHAGGAARSDGLGVHGLISSAPSGGRPLHVLGLSRAPCFAPEYRLAAGPPHGHGAIAGPMSSLHDRQRASYGAKTQRPHTSHRRNRR